MRKIREYRCPELNCGNEFWVDFNNLDYPIFCPFCGGRSYKRDWVLSQELYTLVYACDIRSAREVL